ncbi:hypothetical protein DSUL_20290 [Desulfovibrionales bacterium]
MEKLIPCRRVIEEVGELRGAERGRMYGFFVFFYHNVLNFVLSDSADNVARHIILSVFSPYVHVKASPEMWKGYRMGFAQS